MSAVKPRRPVPKFGWREQTTQKIKPGDKVKYLFSADHHGLDSTFTLMNNAIHIDPFTQATGLAESSYEISGGSVILVNWNKSVCGRSYGDPIGTWAVYPQLLEVIG